MVRKQAAPSKGEGDDKGQVISAIKKMFEDLKSSLQHEVGELKKSVEFISTKFDDLREELAQVRKEVKSNQDQLRALTKENENLKLEVNDLQQYTRRENIMIFGVPETDGQSTSDDIENVSQAIGGAHLLSDVSIAHRLPAKPGKTRPIVARFFRRSSRDEWLHLFRQEAKKDFSGPGIPTKKVNTHLPPGRVTAGEQLTKETRDLLNRTRDAARMNDYKFVWTRDGKVFVRKNEQSNVIRIVHSRDLSNM